DGGEFRAAKHGPFPLGHLDPPHAANAHVVLQTEPAIGGSLATSQGRRKRAPSFPRPWRILSGPVALTPSLAASRTAARASPTPMVQAAIKRPEGEREPGRTPRWFPADRALRFCLPHRSYSYRID